VRPLILAFSLAKFNHGNCLGNLIPKTIVKLYKIAVSALETGNLVELQAARDLQDLGLWRNSSFNNAASTWLTISTVAEIDWAIVQAGIGGTKYALNTYIQEGLGGVPRIPLLPADESVKVMLDAPMKRALAYENSLWTTPRWNLGANTLLLSIVLISTHIYLRAT
jgi:hypothetical protein